MKYKTIWQPYNVGTVFYVDVVSEADIH